MADNSSILDILNTFALSAFGWLISLLDIPRVANETFCSSVYSASKYCRDIDAVWAADTFELVSICWLFLDLAKWIAGKWEALFWGALAGKLLAATVFSLLGHNRVLEGTAAFWLWTYHIGTFSWNTDVFETAVINLVRS